MCALEFASNIVESLTKAGRKANMFQWGLMRCFRFKSSPVTFWPHGLRQMPALLTVVNGCYPVKGSTVYIPHGCWDALVYVIKVENHSFQTVCEPLAQCPPAALSSMFVCPSSVPNPGVSHLAQVYGPADLSQRFFKLAPSRQWSSGI